MRKFICTFAVLAFSGSAYGASIISENFQGAAAGFYTSGVIAGTLFSVVSGSIDVLAGPSYGWLCAAPAASTCVDTTGSTNAVPGRGVLQTTNAINLTPGNYQLAFSLVRWNDTQNGGGLQDASLTVNLGSVYTETFAVNSGFTNQTVVRSITVLSGSSSFLTFTDNSGTAAFAGAILDNVALDSVPEPATFGFVGLGAVGVLLARRTRLRNIRS